MTQHLLKSPILSVKLVLGAVVTTGILTLMGVVVVHALIMETQSDINVLQKDLAASAEENRTLRNNLAEAKAPENIVKAAEEFGMITPPTVRYLPAINSGVKE